MGDQVAVLLLEEFRAFRDTEFREFRESVASQQRITAERVTALEVVVRDGLIDNGHDCRMTAVERKVDGLQRWRWQATAIAATVTTVAGWVSKHVFGW
ncbi:hypothetical protein ACOBR2_06450 [Telmatobacter bradus]|uniref:hypothetical protein n=1 Tax=Telmatobacter bradus TaxID=474953 RepID=UPI003B439EE2